MRCIRCGKPLFRDAVVIGTRSGPVYWGPECAKKAGLVVDKLVRLGKMVAPGDDQEDLFKGENGEPIQ